MSKRYLGIDASDGDILLEAERLAAEMGLEPGSQVFVPLYRPVSHEPIEEQPAMVPSSDHTAVVLLRVPGKQASRILKRPPVFPDQATSDPND